MAKGEKTKAAERAYAAQIKRLRRQISRMQERGYQMTKKVIPDRPSRINKKSVEKLKKIKGSDLYKKAVKIQETPEGFQVIKGTEARKAERRASAKKAAETRKAKSFTASTVLENIEYMISTAGDDQYEAALDLQDVLNQNISKYGRNEVARLFMESSSEAIEAAQTAIKYRVGSRQHNTAIDAIWKILSYGEIPTMMEAAQRQNRSAESADDKAY